MELKEFYNKNVRIKSSNKRIFEGQVVEYVYPDDNESEIESIIIDDIITGDLIEFYANDIESIEIL